jgi:AbrB family looped-hinge helix DNA binding protein
MTAKGQVTIPRRIREKLGLEPGDQVEFVEEKGDVRVKKRVDLAAVRAALEEYRGYFRGLAGTDSDELVEEMRGPGLQGDKLSQQTYALPVKKSGR